MQSQGTQWREKALSTLETNTRLLPAFLSGSLTCSNKKRLLQRDYAFISADDISSLMYNQAKVTNYLWFVKTLQEFSPWILQRILSILCNVPLDDLHSFRGQAPQLPRPAPSVLFPWYWVYSQHCLQKQFLPDIFRIKAQLWRWHKWLSLGRDPRVDHLVEPAWLNDRKQRPQEAQRPPQGYPAWPWRNPRVGDWKHGTGVIWKVIEIPFLSNLITVRFVGTSLEEEAAINAV